MALLSWGVLQLARASNRELDHLLRERQARRVSNWLQLKTKTNFKYCNKEILVAPCIRTVLMQVKQQCIYFFWLHIYMSYNTCMFKFVSPFLYPAWEALPPSFLTTSGNFWAEPCNYNTYWEMTYRHSRCIVLVGCRRVRQCWHSTLWLEQQLTPSRWGGWCLHYTGSQWSNQWWKWDLKNNNYATQ